MVRQRSVELLVVRGLALISLIYCTSSYVRAQQTRECANGEESLHNWMNTTNDSLVSFTCENASNSKMLVCGDSDWGDEEATVVCRKLGCLRGTGGGKHIFLSIRYLWRIQCTGSEQHLRDCAITKLNKSECQSTGIAIITGCYHFLELTVSPSNITVSEGDKAHICSSLNGNLRDVANISIETKNKQAMANYDYIGLKDTITFGPMKSIQCVDIQIVDDSLEEGLESFTVQVTSNSSEIVVMTSQVIVHIQKSDGDVSCVDGSVRLVSDVEQSSLQLVEMCSEGVWSPVCDYNWTVADATVVCRELGLSTDDVFTKQVAGHRQKMDTVTCQGNETKLANCSIEPGTLPCHFVLVHCNHRSSQGSGGEAPVGAVVGAVIAVLVVGVGVAVLVVVIGVIWWKKKHLKPGNTGPSFEKSEKGNDYTSAKTYVRPACEPAASSHNTLHMDNPVYSTAEQPRTVATPEHKLINPLYGHINISSSPPRGQAINLVPNEYAQPIKTKLHQIT